MSREMGLGLAAKPRRRGFLAARQGKFLIGGLLVLLALGYLMFRGFQSAAVYYLSVDEIQGKASTYYGQEVRVSGWVAPGSIQWDPKSLRVSFAIADKGGSQTLSVVYKGALPDLFKDDAEVVVEGTYTDGGLLEAKKLLTKCPSKYVPSL